jgi:organic radical activating enzyme
MVRYKFIEHENKTDAPFVGAMICASECHLKCKGCGTRSAKKFTTLKFTAEEIIQQVLSNTHNEGVILSGLEWSETPEDMVELVAEADKQGLQIMIYTGLELPEFFQRIGEYYVKNKTKFELPKNNLSEFMPEKDLWQYIGSAILDYHIKGDYRVKTGAFERDKLTPDREYEGVKLSSENQLVYVFKK